MVRTPFDKLPASNRKKLAFEIRRKLHEGIKALSKFSDSACRGEPEWPERRMLASLQRQISHFRELSHRGETATPFQIIRDIDRRWETLKLRRTIERAMKGLEAYIGRSILAEVNSAALFSRISSRKAAAANSTHLRRLIRNEVAANATDIDIMLPLLPPSFRKMKGLLSDAYGKATLRPGDFTQILAAYARVSQEALTCQLRLWEARRRLADPLRRFFFELGRASDRKRLFGFSKDEIEKWKQAEVRQATRIRVKKLRDLRKKART